jgi:hypothetical protein
MNRDHTMGFVMTICRHITHHVTETFKPCSSACRPQVPLPEVVRGGRQALRGRSIANPNETLENMNELMDDKKPHDCDERPLRMPTAGSPTKSFGSSVFSIRMSGVMPYL